MPPPAWLGTAAAAGAVALAVLGAWGSARVEAGLENLAQGAAYTLSRQPDYDLTADDGDMRQLTDGRRVNGTMWTSREGVAWRADARPIAIEIDLARQQPVGRICLSSARRQGAGVSYPRRVDVFTSADRNAYSWHGRMTPLATGGEGEYEAREFCLRDIARAARFVRLQVTAQGAYFVTDEISVLRSPARSPVPVAKDTIAPRALVDFALEHEALSQAAGALATRLNQADGTQALVARSSSMRARLDGAGGELGPDDLAALDGALAGLVRDLRRAEGKGPIDALPADPWRLATPLDGAVSADAGGVLRVPAGGHGAVAVAVEHTQSAALSFTVTADIAGEAAAGLTADLREVDFVTRADGVRLGDPLRPLTAGQLEVGVGVTRQVWVVLHARSSVPAGDATVTVRLTADIEGVAVSREVRFQVAIHDQPAAGPPPATVVWGYLDWRPLKAHGRAAARDMLAHGVTTAVIPAWHGVPWPKPGATTSSAEIGDYRLFDAVMTTLAGHREFLFFLSFNEDSVLRSFNRRHEFLSESWKALFVAWIGEWSRRMAAAGLGYDAFAFYPVDEPQLGAAHDTLVEVGRLIRKADPRLRVYATVHVPAVLTDRLIDAVDIFQLNGGALTPDTIGRLKARGRIVRSYATTGGGKAGDPAAFYRAQAWEAFDLGLDGFGFWAYADTGNTGSAWNDVDDVRPDFAVIYESPDGIVSSKRWEAWREGVQDYALISAAWAAAADAETRELVRGLVRQGRARITDAKALAEVKDRLRRLASQPSAGRR